MKKRLYICILASMVGLYAAEGAVTTYTFRNAQWGSKAGTVVTDGKTDGWQSLKDGASWSEGRETPQGMMYAGVQVTANSSGAGAESVVSFEEVRRITVNYRTNASKGKGTIRFTIGGTEVPSAISVERPEKGKGEINREAELVLPAPQTGRVQFAVECTENSIYINEISIYAQTAGPNVQGVTRDAFSLLTDAAELQDGDEVIFGVAESGKDYVMGLFDEWNSRNNIYALRAVYTADRGTVNEQAEAVYTVHTGRSDGGRYYAFADVDGYWLTASGGNPNRGENNRLTVWDTIYSTSYGWYGAWTVDISETGEAHVMCLGNSRSKYIQFNPNGGTPMFACYKEENQTPIALYKKVRAGAGTEPYIGTGRLQLGTVWQTGSGSTVTEVNAMNLTEDISVRLQTGGVFSTDRELVDRDGGRLTISYTATETGRYTDTLVLQSGGYSVRVPIGVTVESERTTEQAKQLADLTLCRLGTVTVTKKYDKYIFVRDETGALLLFDSGNLYGKDLKSGDILTGVTGRYKNYYGNGEIALTEAFSSRRGEEAAADTLQHLPDSTDTGRWVCLQGVQFDGTTALLQNGKRLPLHDLFNFCKDFSPAANTTYDVTGIVYYYEGVTLCPAKAEVQTTSGWNEAERGKVRSNERYTLTGQRTGDRPTGMPYVEDGKVRWN